MKCKFCSAPLPKSGLVCDYCGKRNPLNLSILSVSDIEDETDVPPLLCPVCSVSLDPINIGRKQEVVVQHCSQCDGIFISEDNLEKSIRHHIGEAHTLDTRLLRFVLNNPRQKKERVIRYKKCPSCDRTMQRLNYKAVSGVIVDRCLRHGVWLDGGELRQIFEWKQAGGEIKAKEKLSRQKQESSRSRSLYTPKESDSFSFDPIGDFFNWIQGA